MKQVYVSLIVDLLHSDHINILKEASKLGKVTVGLLTLEACGELNDIPYIEYEKRKEVLESLSLISNILPQKTASYKNNLEQLKPDYVVHRDDWKNSYKNEIMKTLKQCGSKLIEVRYNEDINDLKIKEEMIKFGNSNNIETHNTLSNYGYEK